MSVDQKYHLCSVLVLSVNVKVCGIFSAHVNKWLNFVFNLKRVCSYHQFAAVCPVFVSEAKAVE